MLIRAYLSILSICQSDPDILLNEIVLTESVVRDCLLALDPNKASGPDNIPARILKLTADQVAPSACRLFNLSLQLGVMPTAWKEANITPAFKNGIDACVENYRPISLLCILSKVLERCIYNHIINFISSLYQRNATWLPTTEKLFYSTDSDLS